MTAKKRASALSIGLTGLAVLTFVYAYPRLIVGWLGEANPWTSYLYLYGLGTGFFLIGIRLIHVTGAYKSSRPVDRFWYRILWIGLIFFMTLHAVWILAAQSFPFKG